MSGKGKTRKHTDDSATQSHDEVGFYEAYASFARTLRTWFIAYGIGAPVLLFNQEQTWKHLGELGVRRSVCAIFLIGVAIQVVQAIVYKSAMWKLYIDLPNDPEDGWHRAAHWVSNCYWLEFGMDATTALAFGAATVWVMNVCC